MKSGGNTVLITGGASGIGLALAERFLNAGNKVIICGRRASKLQEAKSKFPSLHTRVCDLTNSEDREDLVRWSSNEFPNLNVLVNNAGIQQWVNVLKPSEKKWEFYRAELAVNLDAPIHLSMLFAEKFSKLDYASIINISSGLAVTPAAWVPLYSATKAALHSFSMTLRLQLEYTKVEVIEIFPPATDTDLGGVGLHTFGVPVNGFADSVFSDLMSGKVEIGYFGTEELLATPRDRLQQSMNNLWDNFKKQNKEF